jgi:hypothetical protein
MLANKRHPHYDGSQAAGGNEVVSDGQRKRKDSRSNIGSESSDERSARADTRPLETAMRAVGEYRSRRSRHPDGPVLRTGFAALEEGTAVDEGLAVRGL